jgi:hypothetical protein
VQLYWNDVVVVVSVPFLFRCLYFKGATLSYYVFIYTIFYLYIILIINFILLIIDPQNEKTKTESQNLIKYWQILNNRYKPQSAGKKKRRLYKPLNK